MARHDGAEQARRDGPEQARQQDYGVQMMTEERRQENFHKIKRRGDGQVIRKQMGMDVDISRQLQELGERPSNRVARKRVTPPSVDIAQIAPPTDVHAELA